MWKKSIAYLLSASLMLSPDTLLLADALDSLAPSSKLEEVQSALQKTSFTRRTQAAKTFAAKPVLIGSITLRGGEFRDIPALRFLDTYNPEQEKRMADYLGLAYDEDITASTVLEAWWKKTQHQILEHVQDIKRRYAWLNLFDKDTVVHLYTEAHAENLGHWDQDGALTLDAHTYRKPTPDRHAQVMGMVNKAILLHEALHESKVFHDAVKAALPGQTEQVLAAAVEIYAGYMEAKFLRDALAQSGMADAKEILEAAGVDMAPLEALGALGNTEDVLRAITRGRHGPSLNVFDVLPGAEETIAAAWPAFSDGLEHKALEHAAMESAKLAFNSAQHYLNNALASVRFALSSAQLDAQDPKYRRNVEKNLKVLKERFGLLQNIKNPYALAATAPGLSDVYDLEALGDAGKIPADADPKETALRIAIAKQFLSKLKPLIQALQLPDFSSPEEMANFNGAMNLLHEQLRVHPVALQAPSDHTLNAPITIAYSDGKPVVTPPLDVLPAAPATVQKPAAVSIGLRFWRAPWVQALLGLLIYARAAGADWKQTLSSPDNWPGVVAVAVFLGGMGILAWQQLRPKLSGWKLWSYKTPLPKAWGLVSQGAMEDARLALLLDKDVPPIKQEQLGFIARHQDRVGKDVEKVARRLGVFAEAMVQALRLSGFSHDCWKGHTEVVDAILSPQRFSAEEKQQKLYPYANRSADILNAATGSGNSLGVTPMESYLVDYHREPWKLLRHPESQGPAEAMEWLKLGSILYAVNRLDTVMDPTQPGRDIVDIDRMPSYLKQTIFAELLANVQKVLEDGIGLASEGKWSKEFADTALQQYKQFLNMRGGLGDVIADVFREREEAIDRKLQGKAVEEQVGILIPYGSALERPWPFTVEDLMKKLNVDPGDSSVGRIRQAIKDLLAAGTIEELYNGRFVSKEALPGLRHHGLVLELETGDGKKILISEMDVTRLMAVGDVQEIWLSADGSKKAYGLTRWVDEQAVAGRVKPFWVSATHRVFMDPALFDKMAADNALIAMRRLGEHGFHQEFMHADYFRFLKDQHKCEEIIAGPLPGGVGTRHEWAFAEEIPKAVKRGFLMEAHPVAQKPYAWVLTEGADALTRSGWGHYALMDSGNTTDPELQKILVHRDGFSNIAYRRGARLYRMRQLMDLYDDAEARRYLADSLENILADASGKRKEQLGNLLSAATARSIKQARGSGAPEEVARIKREGKRQERAWNALVKPQRATDSVARKKDMETVIQALALLREIPAERKRWLAIALPQKKETAAREALQDAADRLAKALRKQALLGQAFEIARQSYEDMASEFGGFKLDEVLMVASGLAAPMETRVPAEYVAASLLVLVGSDKATANIPQEVLDIAAGARRVQDIGYYPPARVAKRRYVENFANMILKNAGSVPAVLIYLAYQLEFLKRQREQYGLEFERHYALLVDILAEIAHKLHLPKLAQRIKDQIYAKAHPAKYQRLINALKKASGITYEDLLLQAQWMRFGMQSKLRKAGIPGRVVLSLPDIAAWAEMVADGRVDGQSIMLLPGIITLRVILPGGSERNAETEEQFRKVASLAGLRAHSTPLGDSAFSRVLAVEESVLNAWLSERGIHEEAEIEQYRRRWERINRLAKKINTPDFLTPLRVKVQTQGMYSAELTGMRLNSLATGGKGDDPLDPAGSGRGVPDRTAEIEELLRNLLQEHRLADFEFIRLGEMPASGGYVERVYDIARRFGDAEDARPMVNDVLEQRGYRDIGKIGKSLLLDVIEIATGEERVGTGDVLKIISGELPAAPAVSPRALAFLHEHFSAEQQREIQRTKLRTIARLVKKRSQGKVMLRPEEGIIPEGYTTQTMLLRPKDAENLLNAEFVQWGISGDNPLLELCLALYTDEIPVEAVVLALLMRADMQRGEIMLARAGVHVRNPDVAKNLPEIARPLFGMHYPNRPADAARELDDLCLLVGRDLVSFADIEAAVKNAGAQALKKIGLEPGDAEALNLLQAVLPRVPEEWPQGSWDRLSMAMALGMIPEDRLKNTVMQLMQEREVARIAAEFEARRRMEEAAKEKLLGEVLLGPKAPAKTLDSSFAQAEQIADALIAMDKQVRASLGERDALVYYKIVDGKDVFLIKSYFDEGRKDEMDVTISRDYFDDPERLRSALIRIYRYNRIMQAEGMAGIDFGMREALANVLIQISSIMDAWRSQVPVHAAALLPAQERGILDKDTMQMVIAYVVERNKDSSYEAIRNAMQRLPEEGMKYLKDPAFLSAVLPALLGLQEHRWTAKDLEFYASRVHASLRSPAINDSVAAMQVALPFKEELNLWAKNKLQQVMDDIGKLWAGADITAQDPIRSELRQQLERVTEEFQSLASGQTESQRNVQAAMMQVLSPFIADVQDKARAWAAAASEGPEKERQALQSLRFAVARLAVRNTEVWNATEIPKMEFVFVDGQIAFPYLLHHGDMPAPVLRLDHESLVPRYIELIKDGTMGSDWELLLYLSHKPQEAKPLLLEILKALPAARRRDWFVNALGMQPPEQERPWAHAYREQRGQWSYEQAGDMARHLAELMEDLSLEKSSSEFWKLLKGLPVPQGRMERKPTWLDSEGIVDARGRRWDDWVSFLAQWDAQRWKEYLDEWNLEAQASMARRVADIVQQTHIHMSITPFVQAKITPSQRERRQEAAEELEIRRAAEQKIKLAQKKGLSVGDLKSEMDRLREKRKEKEKKRRGYLETDKTESPSEQISDLGAAGLPMSADSKAASKQLNRWREKVNGYAMALALARKTPGDEMQAFSGYAAALIIMSGHLRELRYLDEPNRYFAMNLSNTVNRAFEDAAERVAALSADAPEEARKTMEIWLSVPHVSPAPMKNMVSQERLRTIMQEILSVMASKEPEKATRLVRNILDAGDDIARSVLLPLLNASQQHLLEGNPDSAAIVQAIAHPEAEPLDAGEGADAEALMGRAA